MRTNDTGEAVRERVAIDVPAGGTIAGTVRTPSARPPAAVVVIHPATAVPERLYSGFADHLAAHGFAVVTYDYRGTGASGNPRTHRDLRMRDWMETDVPTVAAWARGRFPDPPHLAVGHSIGGHALALANGTEGLAGFVAVASHAGVTKTIPAASERLRVWAILRVLGPVTSHLFGYVPGRRLGVGEDMPGAAMREWSRWSRSPGYFFDDPGMNARERAASTTTDVLAIGFSDDPWATPAQIDAIFDRLTAAEVERRTYTPEQGGVAAIGHTGFFRRALRDTLWGDVRDWLRGKAGLPHG
ncbi:putative alpha/beta hydrolase [Stackebrandtia albiflava]|uniref:Putative alpha/beta hydrolase n=1 Tax=Stackebrandtia albiflava TaxID=406432 RepID=A0A562UPP7_9ACTN|nr:alpha/beta fold hydrolase [Stackebrandtia albiflava]TWJ07589.1 putative alpha/beta hydrolase [Stackebrandtia albiflava]